MRRSLASAARPSAPILAVPLLAILLLGGLGACDDGGELGPPGRIHPGGGAATLVRPDTPGGGLQFSFDPGDVVETHGSSDGRFLVHFTRDGTHAVPSADEDGSGIPDFVEQVADVYVEVLAHVESLGLRAPLSDADVADNGGDDRFDVYLVDFAGIGDGAYRNDACLPGEPDRCAGFMTQENDYAGYGYPSTRVANRILGSHEFFHAVQAAYDVDQGSVLAEGSAVWFTETFDGTLRDFEYFLDGYLENPDRPLDEPLPGPVDPFSYGSAIFFRFLEERFGASMVGALLEATVDGAGGVADPYWLDQLDGVLAAEAGSGFADAFTEFAAWNLETDDFDDPEAGYANGDDYPRVRIDDAVAPFQEDALRAYRASATYFGVPPGGRGEMAAALAGDPLEMEGLVLLVATEAGDAVSEVTVSADPSTPVSIDTSGADRLLVAVVNTAIAGDSMRPGVCIGDPDEVAACQAALALPEGTGGGGGAGGGATTTAASTSSASGAGGGDAATTSTAGAGGGDDAEPGDDEGCGCEVPGAPRRGAGAALALALSGAFALRRRARARARG